MRENMCDKAAMDSVENQPTRWRNREHYLKAALLGGGVSGVLSMIPVINWLNLFFFCLVVVGGVASVYWVQKKTGTVDAMEGAVIGALGGVVHGVLYLVFGFCGVSVLSAVTLPDMPSSQVEEFVGVMAASMGAMCCLSFTIYPLMSGLGGLLAASIWPPGAQGAVGAAGGAGDRREPTEADIAKRKKVTKIVLGLLGGGLLLMALFCGLAGYLFYLEERGPMDTAGDEEIVSRAVVPGELMVIEIGETSGTARYGLWFVSDDELPPSLFEIEGRSGCRVNYSYGGAREPSLLPIMGYMGPDEDEPRWLFFDSVTSYGGDSVTCYVRIDTLPEGVSNPRISVTKVTRPSDWL